MRSISTKRDEGLVILGGVSDMSVKATVLLENPDFNGEVWAEAGPDTRAEGVLPPEVDGRCEELPGLAMKRSVSTASASIAAFWLAVRCFVPTDLGELTDRYPPEVVLAGWGRLRAPGTMFAGGASADFSGPFTGVCREIVPLIC